ncbi:uncharacterized protein LOC143217702 [Lasioglossum baleicum]|uniref:uncharacterized protein LOC143217702 n=1 Tax=Lasioglossum baleicum TaxID=434251 RepID=UPI003FCD4C94
MRKKQDIGMADPRDCEKSKADARDLEELEAELRDHEESEEETGIQDMNSGRPVIRVDADSNTNTSPRVIIDRCDQPPNDVSEGLVESAKVLHHTLKYVGVGLTVAAVAIDAWRIGASIKNDLYVRDHRNEIITELEDAIERLKKALDNETSLEKKENIRDGIERLEGILRDVKRSRKVPVKTIKAVSSVAGAWSAGVVGGAGGAWAGVYTGAAIGSWFGPVGTAVGAPIGAVVGALGFGIGSAMIGSRVGESAAEASLSVFDD